MRGLILALLAGIVSAGAPDGAATFTSARPSPSISIAEHIVLRWPNGRVRVDAMRINGVREGEYRTYYEDGRPYELKHYAGGREDGRQQAWGDDGTLFLNYDVRDGRTYGLINARPCVPATTTATRRGAR